MDWFKRYNLTSDLFFSVMWQCLWVDMNLTFKFILPGIDNHIGVVIAYKRGGFDGFQDYYSIFLGKFNSVTKKVTSSTLYRFQRISSSCLVRKVKHKNRLDWIVMSIEHKELNVCNGDKNGWNGYNVLHTISNYFVNYHFYGSQNLFHACRSFRQSFARCNNGTQRYNM